jgi:hypothetical protein
MRCAAAVVTVAIAGAAPSVGFGQSMCRQSCTPNYEQCLGGGKAEQACLASWHQCKARCEARMGFTPVRVAVPVKPANQSKAVIGKH